MRPLLLLLVVLSRAVMLAQPASSPLSDWSRLQNLTPGSRIVITDNRGPLLNVLANRRYPCSVESITEDGIQCATFIGGFWVGRSVIREVHLPDGGKTILRGMAIGTAAGAGLAAIPHDGTTSDAGSRAALGGIFGFFFGWFIASLFHPVGHLLYQQI